MGPNCKGTFIPQKEVEHCPSWQPRVNWTFKGPEVIQDGKEKWRLFEGLFGKVNPEFFIGLSLRSCTPLGRGENVNPKAADRVHFCDFWTQHSWDVGGAPPATSVLPGASSSRDRTLCLSYQLHVGTSFQSLKKCIQAVFQR